MKKTEDSVKAKWQKKIDEMKMKADFKYNVILSNKKAKIEKEWDYEYEKIEKKKRSYIKKKEEQYLRKMRNEIRELQWKPQREYKTPWPKITPLEFAMQIAQENAKLRDTNLWWAWRCISCGKFCSWSDLAWWHRYSRRFKTVCLEPTNINAQCHNCNWITWPKGNPVEKERVNANYDRNLDNKYWEWAAQHLKDMIVKDVRCKGKKYDLDRMIPKLIKQNEEFWKEKKFYKPWRNWRNTWEEYKKRHP